VPTTASDIRLLPYETLECLQRPVGAFRFLQQVAREVVVLQEPGVRVNTTLELVLTSGYFVRLMNETERREHPPAAQAVEEMVPCGRCSSRRRRSRIERRDLRTSRYWKKMAP